MQCNLFLIDNLQNKNGAEKKKDGEANKGNAYFNLRNLKKKSITKKQKTLLLRVDSNSRIQQNLNQSLDHMES